MCVSKRVLQCSRYKTCRRTTWSPLVETWYRVKKRREICLRQYFRNTCVLHQSQGVLKNKGTTSTIKLSLTRVPFFVLRHFLFRNQIKISLEFNCSQLSLDYSSKIFVTAIADNIQLWLTIRDSFSKSLKFLLIQFTRVTDLIVWLGIAVNNSDFFEIVSSTWRKTYCKNRR